MISCCFNCWYRYNLVLSKAWHFALLNKRSEALDEKFFLEGIELLEKIFSKNDFRLAETNKTKRKFTAISVKLTFWHQRPLHFATKQAIL